MEGVGTKIRGLQSQEIDDVIVAINAKLRGKPTDLLEAL